MLFVVGTTSSCVVRHTASMPSSCNEQLELIPGLLAKGCIERDVNAKMDLGSVTISGQWILDKPGCEELLVKLSFQLSGGERAQARELVRVGGWARRAQA